ncbi:MAG: protein translocase subunit SecD [Thermoanaerobaculia bacterium]|nr:protein translocase subunit SecD [Thermoanaerobaculia bacterium]
MDRTLLTRFLLILAVLAVAAFQAYPPSDSINLGLDLQGGMHLVLRVHTEDALKSETDNAVINMERLLEELEMEGESRRTSDNTFQIIGLVSDDATEFKRTVENDQRQPGWNVVREADSALSFAMTANEEANVRQSAVDQAQQTIRNRIDEFGVAEPVIHDEGLGSERVVVQLPGIDDPERVKELIKSTAVLELYLVAEGTGEAPTEQAAIDQLPAGLGTEYQVVREPKFDADGNSIGEGYWVLETRRVISGRDLRDARDTLGEFNDPQVAFFLNRDGARKFGEVTEANIGRGLSIVLDGQVRSVATIQDKITDNGVIHGNFTQQEVQDLVTVLKSGALPAEMTYLEERTVGPTLGRDSIEQGKKAGLFGLTLVVLAMFVVYKLTGINAIVALGLNIVFVFGALAAFGATLTLPGIAGIILTVGMAVDANVLIFERIREELRSGRTVKSAIAAGFAKALSSVLDANITTLIAAIFLFMFGTGPIRGFAVTLSVGIIASVFTAVFISRFIFDLLYARKQRVDKISI